MMTYTHLYHGTESLLSFIEGICSDENNKYLVQIYTAKDKSQLLHIYNTLREQLNNPTVIGAYTSDIVYNGSIYNDKTVVCITQLRQVNVDIICQGHQDINQVNIPKVLYNQPNMRTHIQMLSTLPYIQSKILLATLTDILPNAVMSGGIIESSVALFFDGEFHETGYLGIVFYGEQLKSHYFNTSSIIPIGKEHTITKAKGNCISEIDNMSAKQFYESYLSHEIKDNIDYFGFKFPLVIMQNNVLLPSSVKTSDNDTCVTSKIHVQPGDQVTLGYADINYYIDEYKVFRSSLPTVPCQYLVTFTSRPRTYELVDHMQDASFNLPIFGLLTDYEFIHNNEDNYISSETSSISCFSSSANSFIQLEEKNLQIDISIEEAEHSVLLKLVENTSKELNSLNKTLEKLVVEKTDELLNHYYTDQLTHLPNLNRLMEELNDKDINALCLIDISAFININNFYGATIGNKVLKELSSLIVDFNNLNHFTTYRVHSDIFAVTCRESSFKLFSNRMRLLQTKIHKHCFINNNQQIYINTTLAISNMILALYENTSMTLQHAKAKKLSYLIYNEHLKIEDSIISNLTWTSKIRNAIDEDRIVPFFQPLYNNASESIDRFEVLMRLIDEDDNIVTPFQFLPIAKKAGLYDKLTKTIIRKAFEYFEDKPYKFSINLSAEDIVNPITRSYIYNRLSAFSHPENVIFELVESESIENYDTMITFINECKRYGASIAIDDFGTGFSNFHYLFKLNVDCIKIDGTIIQQMQSDPSAEMVAETIVNFANKMGIYTVAEYVSDEYIFNKTKELGIDFSQGYFVARPASDIVM